MAGDWIKMRACLATDPKVVAIGRFLANQRAFLDWVTGSSVQDVYLCDGALRYIVTGALHNAWCNAQEHASQEVILGADFKWLDDVTGVPHFGAAMGSVGWAQESTDGLILPKFNNHNTSGAERQRRYRERKRDKSDVTRDVTRNVTLRPREEKRREDSNTPLPPFSKLQELWNSIPGIRKCQSASADRVKAWKTRLGSKGFADNWQAALAKFPLRCFSTQPDGWQPDIDWFLRPKTVLAIIEGKYDWEKDAQRSLPIDDSPPPRSDAPTAEQLRREREAVRRQYEEDEAGS